MEFAWIIASPLMRCRRPSLVRSRFLKKCVRVRVRVRVRSARARQRRHYYYILFYAIIDYEDG